MDFITIPDLNIFVEFVDLNMHKVIVTEVL